MTQEEKAKAHDEALKVIKKCVPDENGFITIYPQEIFPELNEDEDDKIKQRIIKLIKMSSEVGGFALHKWEADEMLAWLEKQGEQKPVLEMKIPEESLGIDSETYSKIVDECIYGEQKPADKVEPKFHKGKWITNGDYIWQIVNVTNLDYILQSQNGHIVYDTISHVDEQFHTFTIQDAKDGDVLSYRDGQWIFIYKNYVDDNSFEYYALYSTIHQDLTINDAGFTLLGDAITPATKEQHDALMKAIVEAGYIFDFEEKELKKIEQKPSETQADNNPAWSEEDEEMFNELIRYFKFSISYNGEGSESAEKWKKRMNWFKSLKDKVQSKLEWSKEDDEIINFIKALCDDKDDVCNNALVKKETDRIRGWLESFKDRAQPKQEWSKEDEKIVEHLINLHKVNLKVNHYPDLEVNKRVNELRMFFKSLRPQNRWKPSDEQIEILDMVLSNESMDDNVARILRELREQLNKLMEEDV